VAGWSPISPNRTLGRRCRLGAKLGPGLSLEGGAVVVVSAVVAVVVAAVAVGAAVIRASGGCSSAAMTVGLTLCACECAYDEDKWSTRADPVVQESYARRGLRRWIGFEVQDFSVLIWSVCENEY
jgi:hypothetical protein